jgi:hypothetical protein
MRPGQLEPADTTHIDQEYVSEMNSSYEPFVVELIRLI